MKKWYLIHIEGKFWVAVDGLLSLGFIYNDQGGSGRLKTAQSIKQKVISLGFTETNLNSYCLLIGYNPRCKAEFIITGYDEEGAKRDVGEDNLGVFTVSKFIEEFPKMTQF